MFTALYIILAFAIGGFLGLLIGDNHGYRVGRKANRWPNT